MPDTKKSVLPLEIITVFVIALVRLGLYGFSYFPVIDDWIQYLVYPLFPERWHDVYLNIGLFATRPLAGLFDVYLWGQIPLGSAFLIITCLHAASCVLFLSVARRLGISLGIGFVLIYMMLPINTEATIWLSASTRLVVPMFLTALSLFLLVDKERNLALFWIVQLASLFFYEQVALLSSVLCFSAAFYMKRKRAMMIPIINFFFLGGYYSIFSSMGAFAKRSMVSMPTMQRIDQLGREMMDGWVFSHVKLYANGIGRGFAVLNENGWFYPFLLVAIFLILLITKKRKTAITAKVENTTYCLCSSDVKKAEYKGHGKLILGFILFILPFLPFLVITQSLSFRNFFPSLIGLGIIFDCILECLPIKRVVAGVLAALFFIVSISELTDYKNVSLADRAFVLTIVEQAKQPDFKVKREQTLIPINVLFGQHITNVTESDWALTGCMRALIENPRFPTIKVE